ncbi:hypothetical protein B0H17DRAFT_1210157 [Mycena rosella]|uniref:Uncharacterized protein n=1 Tax=Mycena rosella TaxID=1033263 RepID=A0AAD7CWU6_MYCRO|nr:hypothetical protein B0H17DRAFT_1210157 [Mycena rosella]
MLEVPGRAEHQPGDDWECSEVSYHGMRRRAGTSVPPNESMVIRRVPKEAGGVVSLAIELSTSLCHVRALAAV